MANASQFVELEATPSRLTLSTPVMGKYVFSSQDIISLKPYKVIGRLGEGVKIRRRVPRYNSSIIF